MTNALRVAVSVLLAGSFALPAHVLAQTCPAPTITGQNLRSNTLVVSRTSYDYQPTVMKDGKYRMWWCGGVAGDYIMYAESDFRNGPWSTPSAIFAPTGGATFDGVHVCDPSVIRVGGTYYMYYGGLGPGGTVRTAIGVATSQNGINWTRLNSGNPIITAGGFNADPYGAGQPTITHVNGWFYLAYTDTTGAAGGGIYVMRSTDPTFQSNAHVLTGAATWATRTPANQTSYRFLATYGVDWQYVDMTNQFAIAINQDQLGSPYTEVRMFDANLTAAQGAITIPGAWMEGPGLVSRPDKHAVPSTQCGIVPLDVFKANGTFGATNTWDLYNAGVDWNTNLSCSCSNLGQVFNGEGIRAPNKPWSVVMGGNAVGFQLAAPIFRVTKNMWDLSDPMFDAVPSLGAALLANAYTIYTDGAPGAFVLTDGRRWPVSCIDVVVDNGSSLSYVPVGTYYSYPAGLDFKCVQ